MKYLLTILKSYMGNIDNERLRLLIKAIINLGQIESDAEFSRITGISQGLLSQITRDDRPLTLKSIEKITKAFPNVNEAYLRGKESNMFLKQKPGYSMANEPQSEYGKDVVKELIEAKNEIIELLKENSRLNAELQDCWLQLGAKREGKQPNFS